MEGPFLRLETQPRQAPLFRSLTAVRDDAGRALAFLLEVLSNERLGGFPRVLLDSEDGLDAHPACLGFVIALADSVERLPPEDTSALIWAAPRGISLRLKFD